MSAFHLKKNLNYFVGSNSQYIELPTTNGSKYTVRVGSYVGLNYLIVFVMELDQTKVSRVEVDCDDGKTIVLDSSFDFFSEVNFFKSCKFKHNEHLLTRRAKFHDLKNIIQAENSKSYFRYLIVFDDVEFDTNSGDEVINKLVMPNLLKTAAATYLRGVGLDLDIVYEGMHIYYRSII